MDKEAMFQNAYDRGVSSFTVPCSVENGELVVVDQEMFKEAKAYEAWLQDKRKRAWAALG